MTRPALLWLLLLPSIAGANPRLGTLEVVRGRKYIVNFKLAEVAPQPEIEGRGGVTTENGLRVERCMDSPDFYMQDQPSPLSLTADDGLEIEVMPGKDVRRSGRGWQGRACEYTVRSVGDPSRSVVVTDVPWFNTLTGVWRQGDIVYVSLQYNGYAKEIRGHGNLIVALDLKSHKELWRTPDLVSNAAMLVVKGLLITGYGFTAEGASLSVFDAATGKPLQRIKIPKAPDDMVVFKDQLYVQIYDGYVRAPILDGPP